MFGMFKEVRKGAVELRSDVRDTVVKTGAMVLVALGGLMHCGAGNAATFDCMGRTLAGYDSTGKTRAFGTMVGDSANPQTYVHYDKTTGKSAGMAFYWYCRLPDNSVRVNNLHATMPQLSAFPSYIVAHMGAHGPVFFKQAQARQCWELEAANSYPTVDEKTLCQSMLVQARAAAPR
jgi:hypothetical protein